MNNGSKFVDDSYIKELVDQITEELKKSKKDEEKYEKIASCASDIMSYLVDFLKKERKNESNIEKMEN